MILAVLWAFLISFLEPVPATKFSSHDQWNPNPHLACWRALGRSHARELDDRRDMVVAHRTLPCGSAITICSPRTGLCTEAVVGDRGPFGRYRRGSRKGRYISMLDIAPAVARRIRFNGFEKVWYWPSRRMLVARRD